MMVVKSANNMDVKMEINTVKIFWIVSLIGFSGNNSSQKNRQII